MPRLSILIPWRESTALFEATLVSVLACRPENAEVIVVHRGEYADPYELRREVLLVEHDEDASLQWIRIHRVFQRRVSVVWTSFFRFRLLKKTPEIFRETPFLARGAETTLLTRKCQKEMSPTHHDGFGESLRRAIQQR